MKTPPAAGALGTDVKGELEAHKGEKQSSLQGQRGQLHSSIPVNTQESEVTRESKPEGTSREDSVGTRKNYSKLTSQQKSG